MKNVYTCRLARLISPVGSLWIYCKRFLRFLSDPDRLCCSPFWKSITASHILAGALHVARATEARMKYCKPILRALSLLVAVYRMSNEMYRILCFDVLTANTSPLDPVNFTIFDHVCWPFTFLSCEAVSTPAASCSAGYFSPTWPTWRFWGLSRCSFSGKVRRGSRLLFKPLFLSPFISHIADIGRPS